jgi:hypothetical protein
LSLVVKTYGVDGRKLLVRDPGVGHDGGSCVPSDGEVEMKERKGGME